ncbi:unnamed protein product, partial [Mesorhabditis spiculigera]
MYFLRQVETGLQAVQHVQAEQKLLAAEAGQLPPEVRTEREKQLNALLELLFAPHAEAIRSVAHEHQLETVQKILIMQRAQARQAVQCERQALESQAKQTERQAQAAQVASKAQAEKRALAVRAAGAAQAVQRAEALHAEHELRMRAVQALRVEHEASAMRARQEQELRDEQWAREVQAAQALQLEQALLIQENLCSEAVQAVEAKSRKLSQVVQAGPGKQAPAVQAESASVEDQLKALQAVEAMLQRQRQALHDHEKVAQTVQAIRPQTEQANWYEADQAIRSATDAVMASKLQILSLTVTKSKVRAQIMKTAIENQVNAFKQLQTGLDGDIGASGAAQADSAKDSEAKPEANRSQAEEAERIAWRSQMPTSTRRLLIHLAVKALLEVKPEFRRTPAHIKALADRACLAEKAAFATATNREEYYCSLTDAVSWEFEHGTA